jgi:hypothetical protein
MQSKLQRSAAVPVTIVSAVSMRPSGRGHHHDADVIGAVVHQEVAVLPQRPTVLPNSVIVCFGTEVVPIQVGDGSDAAFLDGKSYEPVGQHADAVP